MPGALLLTALRVPTAIAVGGCGNVSNVNFPSQLTCVQAYSHIIDDNFRASKLNYEIHTDDHCIVVSLSGDIDLEFSSDVRILLLENLLKARSLIVDMDGVTLIDSSGVASLLETFQNARKKGKDFIIAAVRDEVMRVFKLAKLETVFDLADSVEDAKRRCT
jgi:anti-sigma B factor antagonist